MKDHDKVIKELNREQKYPPFFSTWDAKRLIMVIGIMCAMAVLIIVVMVAKEWIDSKGHLVGVMVIVIGLLCFSYWALLGRKK